MLDAAEIVLAVWVIAIGEVVEGADLGIEAIKIVHGCDALCDHDAAANERSASSVIQFSNAGRCHQLALV